MKYLKNSFLVSFIFLMVVSISSAQEETPAPLQIRFWHAFGGDLSPYLDRMVADFNQTHPLIQVEMVAQGSYEDAFAKLQTPEEGQALPHILHVSDLDHQIALDSGLFVSPEASSGFISGIENANYLPFNISLPVLYANADLLANAQIKTLPTTLSEVTDVCTRLQVANTPCITWAIDAWIMQNWLGGAGYDSPRMTEVMTWWAELGKSRQYIAPRQIGDWETPLVTFLEGRSAFLIGSSEDAFRLYNEASFTVQDAPLPDSASAYAIRGGGLWLVAGHPAEEQAAAQEFINWLTNTENSVRWTKGSNYLPLRPLALEILLEQGWDSEYPALITAANQLIASENKMYSSAAQRDINLLIEQHIQLILGGREVERTLTTLVDQIARAEAE